jgi:hypothetical protein
LKREASLLVTTKEERSIASRYHGRSVTPLRTLLEHLVDYAGLFPPASLTMRDAVANYERYRESREAYMLARFIVPVSRLDEFESCAESPEKWTLSVLSTGDVEADVRRITCAHARIDTMELKAAGASQIESAMRKMPPGLTPYFEISDLALIPVIAASGARAKIRTGGITPDAFPEAAFIAAFIEACAKSGTPFKATAGLHHPLRSFHALTYSADGPSGWMFGFLNVFLAAVFAQKGMRIEPLLLEQSPEAFTFADTHIAWRGCVVSEQEIASARRDFAISFGSCSFEEPIADLKAVQLL